MSSNLQGSKCFERVLTYPPSKNTPGRVRLPPFSSLPDYIRTPSPPSFPTMYTFPFRVGTPPPSTYTPSYLSSRCTVSPISPTSYPQSSSPSTSSLFPAGQGAAHRGDDPSPSKNRMPRGSGLPTVESPTKARKRANLIAPQPVRPIGADGRVSHGTMKCKWGDCSWTKDPLDRRKWNAHFHSHFVGAPPHEKVEDGKVACMWNGCSGHRVDSEECFDHVRGHEEEFWVYCNACTKPRGYVTVGGLHKHLDGRHG